MGDIENLLINCSICLKENIHEKDRCETNCNHSFCKKCLDDWFDRGKITCPLCRGEIKYFNHDKQFNRIIKLEKRGDLNNLNQTNIQNHLNSRENLNNIEMMIQTILIENRKFKCYFYVTLFTSLTYMANYYICSSYLEDKNIELGICGHNNTVLSQDLNDCYNIVNHLDDSTYVTIYNEDLYSKCYIPTIFYNQCFDI